MSLPTPEARTDAVLRALFGDGGGTRQSQSMRCRIVCTIAQAIREAEDAARKDERATCARIVQSGIRCGAPPESIAAMMNAGAESEPKLPA